MSIGSEVRLSGYTPRLLPASGVHQPELAIMNLLPILPLDGGHLFLIAVEKVIGRPLSARQTMTKIAFFGLALILTLFLFATYADVSKIIEGQPFIPE